MAPKDPPEYCVHGREKRVVNEMTFTGAILDCTCCLNLFGTFEGTKPGQTTGLCRYCQDSVD